MQGSDSFRLIMRRGPQPNQTFDLNKPTSTIGRDITNDIVINDPEVSRHHLRFTQGAGGYTIEDLGSTNGTFINGQRITGARPLNNGDMIGLGETVTLGYEVSRQPSSAAPEEGGGFNATVQSSVPQQPQQPQQPSYSPQQQPQQPPYSPQQATPFNKPDFGNLPADAFGGNESAPPEAPAAGYYGTEEYEEPRQGNSTMRIALIGCAAALVICCCATVGLAYYIDSQCLWWDLPVIGDVLDAVGQEPSLNYDACSRRFG